MYLFCQVRHTICIFINIHSQPHTTNHVSVILVTINFTQYSQLFFKQLHHDSNI